MFYAARFGLFCAINLGKSAGGFTSLLHFAKANSLVMLHYSVSYGFKTKFRKITDKTPGNSRKIRWKKYPEASNETRYIEFVRQLLMHEKTKDMPRL